MGEKGRRGRGDPRRNRRATCRLCGALTFFTCFTSTKVQILTPEELLRI